MRCPNCLEDRGWMRVRFVEGGRACYAKTQCTVCKGTGQVPDPEPAKPVRKSSGVWRRGEDWWTAAEAENGMVPSDATWVDIPEE